MEMKRRDFIGAGAVLAAAGLAGNAEGAAPAAPAATLTAKPVGGARTHFAGRDPRVPPAADGPVFRGFGQYAIMLA